MNKTARTSASQRAFRCAGHGQAITELALLAPLIAIMLLGIVEMSGAYGTKMDLQAATANGARIGAIEGNGGLNLTTCPDTSGGVITDTVDMDVVRAVLSVHGLDQSNISKIEVYKASPGGGVSSGFSNTYIPPFTHTVGTATSLVAAVNGYNWPSCQRSADEPSDSLGVHVSYTYYPLTPLFGRATITMDDQSIQRLNPTKNANPCPISGIPISVTVTTQDYTNPPSYNDIVSWGAIPGATSYAIYQSINGVNGGQFSQTPVYSGTGTLSGDMVQQTLTLTTTPPAPTLYSITGLNFCGEGNRSDPVGDGRPAVAATATAVAAATQTATAATATAAASQSQTATAATATAAAAPTSTPTTIPTATPTSAATATRTATVVPGATATPTTAPGATATTAPVATATSTATATPTATARATATATPTATATTTTVDDQASGANQFTYNGTWVHCSATSSPTCASYGLPASSLYNGTLSFDNQSGDTATMSFTGSSITLYSVLSSSGGQGAVSIDGGSWITVNFHTSGSDVANQTIWTNPTPLTGGLHTFTLRATGAGYVGLDYVTFS